MSYFTSTYPYIYVYIFIYVQMFQPNSLGKQLVRALTNVNE